MTLNLQRRLALFDDRSSIVHYGLIFWNLKVISFISYAFCLRLFERESKNFTIICGCLKVLITLHKES